MRKRKDLMVSLRDKLIEANPGAVPEQIRIERLKPRTLITIIAALSLRTSCCRSWRR